MKLPGMGLLLGSVACLLIGCDSGHHAPDAQVAIDSTHVSLEALKGYRGKDLANLDEDQVSKLLATITALVPHRKYEKLFDFHPCYVWEFSDGGHPLVLLFEVNNTFPHPGSTGIRITAFENSGKVQSESTFWTGHRCYLQSIALQEQEKDAVPLIVLETDGTLLGPDVQKQVYARIGTRFDLVRLESPQGKATRNSYYISHFACGPEVPKQTQAEWEADVLSGNRVKTLRALVWLGGRHWKLQAGDKNEQPSEETLEEIDLVRKVRGSQKVAARLKELAKSEDAWLREAALLASEPEDARW